MLLVDTCGAQGSVGAACLEGSPELRAERVLPGRETQERLMTAIADVLADSGIHLSDLDVLAAITGPGSFTGVRIGLAAIKGLAEALGKPAVALSRLQVLAAQAGQAGPVQAWIDAGRGDVFVGRYRDGLCLGEQMLRGHDAALLIKHGDRVVVTEERLASLYPAAARVASVGVREALPLAWSKAAAGDFADVALLDANYLRVPDAELARRAAEAQRQAEITGVQA